MSIVSVITKNGRIHSTEEEKVTNERFIFLDSEDGKVHLVDLHLTPTNVEVNTSDVTLYLYTIDNPSTPEILTIDNLEDLINSRYFDRNRKNVFTLHGWGGSYASSSNVEIKNALFQIGEDVNVFVVDWNKHAGMFYTFSVWSVPIVGNFVGAYINNIIDYFDLTPAEFSLVGHSLGAQVVGCIGAKVNGLVDVIVGLDPALPMFSLENIDVRLDETDAKYVQVIHTNGGFQGFLTAIGHSDFYPNGGIKQSGCGSDLLGSCSHGRSINFYVESLLTSGFRSLLCDSYENFQRGLCNNNDVRYMGEWNIDKE